MNIAKLVDKSYSEKYRKEEINRQAELLIADLKGESFKNKNARDKNEKLMKEFEDSYYDVEVIKKHFQDYDELANFTCALIKAISQ